jgi:hypothetical protein
MTFRRQARTSERAMLHYDFVEDRTHDDREVQDTSHY